MIQKIFTFSKEMFILLGALMTSYHVTNKITKMSPLFLFSLFPYKKHFYEQNMLVTRLLKRDYIWVLTMIKKVRKREMMPESSCTTDLFEVFE